MDPMTVISMAPPEWFPFLFCVGILLKAFQLWLDRDKYDPEDDSNKESEVVG